MIKILRLCFSFLIAATMIICLYSVSIAPYEYPDIYIGPTPVFGYPEPYPSLSVKDEMDIGANGAMDVHRVIRYNPPSVIQETNLTDFFSETTLTLFKVRTKSNSNLVVNDITVNGEQIEPSDIEITTDDYTSGKIKINPNNPYIIKLNLYLSSPTKVVIHTKAFPFSQTVIATYIEPPRIYNSKEAIERIDHGDEKYIKAWETIYSTNISYAEWLAGPTPSTSFIIVDIKSYDASINLPKHYNIRSDVEGTVYVDWISDIGCDIYNITKITGEDTFSINDVIYDPRISNEVKNDTVRRFLDNNVINATVIQRNSHVTIQSPSVEGLINQIIIWAWVIQSPLLQYLFVVLLFLGICIPRGFGYESFKKLFEGWVGFIGIWISTIFYFWDALPPAPSLYWLLPLYSLFGAIALASEGVLNSISITTKIPKSAIIIISSGIVITIFILCTYPCCIYVFGALY